MKEKLRLNSFVDDISHFEVDIETGSQHIIIEIDVELIDKRHKKLNGNKLRDCENFEFAATKTKTGHEIILIRWHPTHRIQETRVFNGAWTIDSFHEGNEKVMKYKKGDGCG